MTLVLALPAKDGIVFASDGQVTNGLIRSTGTKVFKLNDNAVWGASGELGMIQRVAERLSALPNRNQPLRSIRDNLAAMVSEEQANALRIDFRTAFLSKDPDALLGLHGVDVLLAEWLGGKGTILHLMANGTAEYIEDHCAASGNGALFAHALLQKYSGVLGTCSIEQVKLLAFKVVEEAIDVGAYGLGPPIAVWSLSNEGADLADSASVDALDDAAALLREKEVDLFTTGESTSQTVAVSVPPVDGTQAQSEPAAS